jgi:hypothetical protein
MSNLQKQPVQPDLSQPEYHDIATTNNLSLPPQNSSNTDLIELSTVNNRLGSNGAAVKKRNRRKPNKTTKVFNDDEAHLGLRDDDEMYDGKFNGIDVNGAFQPTVEKPMDTTPIETTNANVKTTTETAATEPLNNPLVNEPEQIGGSGEGSAAQLIVENSLGNNDNLCDSKVQSNDKPATTSEESVVNKDVLEKLDESSKTNVLKTKGKGKPTMTTSTPTANTKKRGRRKTITDNNSDDSEVETIDKIAEMISSTSKEFECSESLSLGGEKSSDTVKTTTVSEPMEISGGSTTTAATATKSNQPVVKELHKNDANYEDVSTFY